MQNKRYVDLGIHYLLPFAEIFYVSREAINEESAVFHAWFYHGLLQKHNSYFARHNFAVNNVAFN